MEITFIVFLLVQYFLGYIAVELIYHRILTHKAAYLHPLLLYPFVFLGLPAGTPLQWVGNHRNHHAYADKEGDNHSPLLFGFWHAHSGWYLERHNTFLAIIYSFAGPLRFAFDGWWRPRTNQQFLNRSEEYLHDRMLVFFSKPLPYLIAMLSHFFVPYIICYLNWGVNYFPFLFMAQVSFFWVGDSVNSAMHIFGKKVYKNKDQSRNLYAFFWFYAGLGLHNNHHAFPNSITNAHGKGQIDILYIFVLLMNSIGLARDLRLPTEKELLRNKLTLK